MELRRLDVMFIVALLLVTVMAVVAIGGHFALWDYIDTIMKFQVGMTKEEVEATWGKPLDTLEPGQESKIPWYEKKGLHIPIRREVYVYAPVPSREDTVYLFFDEEDTVHYIYWFRS